MLSVHPPSKASDLERCSTYPLVKLVTTVSRGPYPLPHHSVRHTACFTKGDPQDKRQKTLYSIQLISNETCLSQFCCHCCQENYSFANEIFTILLSLLKLKYVSFYKRSSFKCYCQSSLRDTRVRKILRRRPLN